MDKFLPSVTRAHFAGRRRGVSAFFVGAVLACCPLPVTAQVQNAATTWEAFGAASFGRAIATSSGSAYGWHASISQYPYTSHAWVGATIEGSGLFESSTVRPENYTLNESLYTVMAGPSFAFAAHGARPFGRALFGAVILNSSASGTAVNTGSISQLPDQRPAGAQVGSQFQSVDSSSVAFANQTVFGSTIGGGLDLPLNHHLSARGTADWITFKEGANDRVDDLRVSTGIVLKF